MDEYRGSIVLGRSHHIRDILTFLPIDITLVMLGWLLV